MNKCPAQNCGRTFQSHIVLEQHLKRRHPRYLAQTSSSQYREKGGEDQIMQEQINKLPKIKQLKMQSKEHRPVEVYRKSLSKGKPEPKVSLNTSKVTSVIADSRSYLETTENTDKKTRRPSLNKKGSSSDLTSAKQERLPQIKSVRQKKLQILGGQGSKLSKNASYEERDPMTMTAPNFNKVEPRDPPREKSKEKLNISQLQDELQGRKSQAQKMMLVKTQQGFQGLHEKESKLHHHGRPLLKRAVDRQKQNVDKNEEIAPKSNEEKGNEGALSPNSPVVSPKQPTKALQIKKELKLKHPGKRDSSLRKGEAKIQNILDSNLNFEERIVVFNEAPSPRLTIPPTAKCEYIYANNLNLSSIALNNLQTLRQISLQHNALKDLAFLNYPNNHNIQKVSVDHNQISFLDYLPPSLRVISATFNLIGGLDINARELGGLNNLQEVDFTFNPIRKEPNYKLNILSVCLSLKKIDGIKITKFDLDMAGEYSRMVDEELGLIPSSKFQNLVVSKCSNSPSTVVSMEQQPESQEMGMTYQELERQIAKLTKITKQTRDNLGIIKQENEIITQQIQQLKGKEEDCTFGSAVLYEKLMGECEALELLNFMQYASEEELQELILKKEKQAAAV